MAAKIVRGEYYHATVKDRPGEAYRLLAELASSGVNLLAFSAVPVGRTRRSSYCSRTGQLLKAAEKAGFEVTGPQHALVITGDDRLGSIAEIHRKLYDARINVYASTGVTAECGRFGYIVYVKDQDYEAAINVLKS
jgi:predicted amino acid-binding ACT domain protein